MLKFSYGEILRRIIEKTGLPKEEIEEKIENKISQLSDLVSKEGAAHIVANQYGVKLFENLGERVIKIKEAVAGSSSVNILCRVLTIYGVNSFNKNGRSGKVASLLVADESSSIRVAIWDENLIKKIEDKEFSEGDILKLKEGYSRENNGRVELHLGNRSSLEVNPKGETIGEVNISIPQQSFSVERKKINELEDGSIAEVLGTIVQVFEPRFYNSCSKCGRKPEEVEDKFKCPEHGIIEIRKSPILNFFVDDGFGNIRVVCFRDNVGKILEIEDVSSLKDSPEKFNEIQRKIAGKQLEISGRITKNDFFNRLEMVANTIADANPKDLAVEMKEK